MKLIDLVMQARQKLGNFTKAIDIGEVRIAPVIDNNELCSIEANLEIVFPDLLRDMYLNSSGGIEFSWFASEEIFGESCCRGTINLLSPQKIYMMYCEMKSIVIESKLDLKELSENEGLKALVDDWEHWIPIALFPNGDAFCIEKRYNSNEIVFLEHDVMDGGPNVHGLKIANSFEDLMIKWSKICFVDIYDWTLGVNDEGIDISNKIFEELLKI